jgi:hypothetical protein
MTELSLDTLAMKVSSSSHDARFTGGRAITRNDTEMS